MEQVYIVERGHEYEESYIKAVHKSYEGALTVVLKEIQENEADEAGTWEKESEYRWTFGGRYISINPHDLED